ncbi:putative Bile acid:sodium symporter/arsenical resistance protein Acr3 [Medicago truncatula]|uniref:Na+-bile acid cotransporter n=3 Tax=Medicago truncatula TaxID=3880 RepID=A0A072UCV8_MEDTR|nr:probable sodium/metabolite cotransporter BASS5, chloroplastic isoform X1 [Medicago truncatula]XP_013453418.1 probable sodium/metabolite cotransporter BASS5, chloroplastic isoform X1 [Medicago truncatula]KEH27447.1 Na+-bile acid cotransporter [Medicago truncatula]RHN53680.1 putative Bile acid:sodium symporter/arsenical resistance protein Acr3 [Medicago truncatula]
MFVEIKNMNSISSSSSSSYSSSTKVMNKPLSQSSLFSLRYYNCNCNCNNISSSSIPFHSNFPPNNIRLAVVSSSRLPLKCASSSTNFSDPTPNHSSHPTKPVKQSFLSILDILKNSNSLLPPAIVSSTLLALIFPPSLTWFTTRYFAPALGFLMFAVGVNSSEKDFIEAFNRPAEIATGYFGQFVVKPLLGYLFYIIAVTVFGLPTGIGAGMVLVACVSGAQLSNYATFLTDPEMAPLSIVMTSLSTASAVFVTPLLLLLLIGKRLPIDVKGMVFSITQIVVVPIAVGLLLNRFFPPICNAIRPFLPPLSVLTAAICAGAPLALNVECIKSPLGISILLLVVAFHLSAFIAGYMLSGSVFRDSPDVKPLQRTISFETGMQSSLLALALANKFFEDPVVGMPPAISTAIMSLMGFGLVLIWNKSGKHETKQST